MSLLDLLDDTRRVPLAHLPTPLEPMPRLTEMLGGPRLWVKRDDCTGLGLGGNKVRKLEYAMAAAVDAGADVVVGVGVPQSNAVRQLAAAAARLGLDCHLVLLTGRVPGTDPEYDAGGNLVLDRLFGAAIEFVPWAGNALAPERAAARLRREGRRPFVVPYGVSSAVGALGYVRFAAEVVEQTRDWDRPPAAIVFAAGSGGTQAGIVAGLAELQPDIAVIGIDVDAEPLRVRDDVVRITAELAELGGVDPSGLEDVIEVVAGHAGPGYGVPTRAMVDAVRTAARFEGLVLDPVYSGKAFGGLIDLVRTERFDRGDRVVFLHTGGAPALWAYPSAFADGERP